MKPRFLDSYTWLCIFSPQHNKAKDFVYLKDINHCTGPIFVMFVNNIELFSKVVTNPKAMQRKCYLNYVCHLVALCLWLVLSLPVMKQLKVEASNGAPTQRVRTKRCACSSPMDSECHYFCHLDIIWVNTPRWTQENAEALTILRTYYIYYTFKF